MPALFAVVSIWQLEEPNSRKSRRLNMPTQAALILTCCDQRFTTASLMPAPYIPDIRLETYGRYYLYEIGFLMVAGGLCMTRFQWKLNLWIWCSGVWPMNCFGRNRCHLGWVDLWDDKDLLGSEFPDHLDHGRSNEPMNFCPEWSHQFIWSSMIWEISDHLSSFGSSQRTHS